jgi:rhodanese-related sulfurtransferase
MREIYIYIFSDAMSDTAVEQQPEHKEEIIAQTGDDIVKKETPTVEANGKTVEGEATGKTDETKDAVKTEKEPSKPKTSFTVTLTCKTIKAKFPGVNQMPTNKFQQLLEDKTSNLVILDARPEEEYNVSHIEGSQRVDPSLTDMEKLLETINSLKLEKGETQVVFYCSLGYRSSQLAARLVNHLKKALQIKAEEAKAAAAEIEKQEAAKAEIEKKEAGSDEVKAEASSEKVDANGVNTEEKTEEKAVETKPEEKSEKKDEPTEQAVTPKPEEEKPGLKISNLEGSLFKWANEDRPMINNESESVKLAHPYNKIWGKCLRKDLRWKAPKPVPVAKEEKTVEKGTEEAKKESEEAKKETDEAKKEETAEPTNASEEAAKTPDEHTQPAEVPTAA